MPYLLDTNVALHLRDKDEAIIARIATLDGLMTLSIVSRVELEGGVYRDPGKAIFRRTRLDAMLRTMEVLVFDAACADAYRGIMESAGYSRRKLLDRMIAAQALVHRATLVTLNGAGFRDVPGLRLLAW